MLHGGLLWAARPPPAGWRPSGSTLRSPLLTRLRVYDTGMPAESTGAVVAAVRRRRDQDPAGHERLLDRIEAATRGFRERAGARGGGPGARPGADPRVRGLPGGAGRRPPEPSAPLVRRVEAEGGAAKISGAGSLAGPGAGSLLVYHPDAERIAGWPFLRPFPFHPVHLGAEGLRRETDA